MERLIAQIIGPPGSGKTEATNHAAQRGLKPVKVSGLIEAYATSRGIMLERRHQYSAALARMQRELGRPILSRTILEMSDPRLWVDGLRSPGDVALVRPHGPVIALECPLQTCYSRIEFRDRGVDHVTYEEFAADELREATNLNPFAASTRTVMQSADYHIDGSLPLEDVLQQIDDILDPLLAA